MVQRHDAFQALAGDMGVDGGGGNISVAEQHLHRAQIGAVTDTVLVASDAAVQSELAAGTLRPIALENFPDTYIEMGVISLHKRTASPMAQHVIQAFQRLVA
jgi:hypothetical protein